jgi:hypothetical protein
MLKWRLIAEFLEEYRWEPVDERFRLLEIFWFPFNTRAARADAIVHAPAAFRRRGLRDAPRAGGRVTTRPCSGSLP